MPNGSFIPDFTPFITFGDNTILKSTFFTGMKFRFKVILYFGFSGVLVSAFFTVLRLVESDFQGSFLNICGNFFENALIAYILTVIVASVVMAVLVRINRLFPWKKNAWLRFAADFVITPIVAMITMVPLAYLTFELGIDFHHATFKQHLTNELVTALVVDLILVGIYESYYFFSLWKQSLIRNEQLEKENLTARYEALKNQINPHFLFNSLNVVSSLIHEDPQRAEEFIDEFSKIYRFLLEHQDKNLHSLQDELTFVKSFLSLQQIRFGDSLISTINIDEDKLDHIIPVLSMQLLVENAIKHNHVTREHPLKIDIGIEGDFVVVKNSLQRRANHLNSTGIGLNNLNARYKMLARRKPEFSETESMYIGKLPLIKELKND